MEEIKNKMAELRTEYQFIMKNVDITGGKGGMENNNRIYLRAEKIKKELLRLNKKLINPKYMWAIQDKQTKELDKERFNTKHEAEVSFENEGGDYDYYRIIEVKNQLKPTLSRI